MIIVISIILLIVSVVLVSGYEVYTNSCIVRLPARPVAENKEDGFDKIMNSNIHEMLYDLENDVQGVDIDFSKIVHACYYIDNRYDCMDFRMQSMLRILFKHSERVPHEYLEIMKKSLLGSKFFMDQKGEDSVCYWSENHQILFAASEYLIGQLFENEVFSNDGLTGKAHKKIAAERINIWLEQRFLYGFTEWYSNTYYEEDIAPLSNLIDFCDDEDIVIRSKMIMDLLLFDLATQSFKGSFTSTSGRAYEAGKKSGKYSALRNVTKHIWGYDVVNEKKGLDLNFLYMDNYDVPEVIKEIGHHQEDVVIKASNGMDLAELVKEMPKGQSLGRVMMQWAMEAFSNPQVVSETMKYIHRNHMISNEFMNGFKLINLSVLKYTNLLPFVSRILRPITNGVAIQRANTYTYKTPHYMLSTTQKYHPGDFGDQQHIWCATVSNDISIFTTHPASPLSEDGALSASPNYWVGNGRNPHSVQDKNINLTIYNINGKKGFMEKSLLLSSHCYFPKSKFDEVVIKNNLAFAKIGKTFISIIGNKDFQVTEEELVQHGRVTSWICELSSNEDETFSEFMTRIESNGVVFDEKEMSLQYESKDKTMKLVYQEEFTINGEYIDTRYQRFESEYSKTMRKSNTISIDYNQHSLFLDYEQGIRVTNVRNL